MSTCGFDWNIHLPEQSCAYFIELLRATMPGDFNVKVGALDKGKYAHWLKLTYYKRQPVGVHLDANIKLHVDYIKFVDGQKIDCNFVHERYAHWLQQI